MLKKSSHTCKAGTNARILRYIVRHSPVSRAGISNALDLSPAMITPIIGNMLAQKLVTDSGEKAANNEKLLGRKRMLLEVNGSFATSVGIEITRNHFFFCVRNFQKKSLAEYTFDPTPEDFEKLNEAIIRGISTVLAKADKIPADIAGIGISVPGHYDMKTNAFISHSYVWKHFDAKKISADLNVPVTCENNVRSMAYAAYFYQRKECPENFVFLHIGAGIFCANFSEGQLSVGDNFISGEVGHTVANPDGLTCECGKSGCLQTYASETWLLKKAAIIYNNFPHSVLRTLAPSSDALTIDQLMCAYDLGDELVTRIIQEAIKYLGVAVANIAIIMSPQKIYLHSRYFKNERFKTGLSDFIDSQLLFVHRTYHVELSILPFDSFRSAHGAAAVALDRLFVNEYTS